MGRRRGNLGRALRSRRKFLTVWVLLLSLAGYQWTKQFCAIQPEGDCSQVIVELRELFWTFLGCLGVLIVLGLWALRLWKARKPEERFHGFRNEPWRFNHSWLRITGTVEKVFQIPLHIRIQRALINAYRTSTGIQDPEGRHPHQAVLISSPQLRPRERLLIRHNTKFGQLRLRQGQWVEVQGEYVHRPSRKRGFLGARKTFYGMMHYTHRPRGHFLLLDAKPSDFPEIEPLRFHQDLLASDPDSE